MNKIKISQNIVQICQVISHLGRFLDTLTEMATTTLISNYILHDPIGSFFKNFFALFSN